MKKAIYLTIAALALLLAFLAGCAVTIRCAVPVGAAQNTNGYTATAVTGSMSFTKGEQNNDHHKRRTGIAGYAAQGNAGEKKPYADYADCWGTSGRDYRV